VPWRLNWLFKSEKTQISGADKILTELITVKVEKLVLRSSNLSVLFGIRRNCLGIRRIRLM
jgi:hypothetical protein